MLEACVYAGNVLSSRRHQRQNQNPKKQKIKWSTTRLNHMTTGGKPPTDTEVTPTSNAHVTRVGLEQRKCGRHRKSQPPQLRCKPKRAKKRPCLRFILHKFWFTYIHLSAVPNTLITDWLGRGGAWTPESQSTGPSQKKAPSLSKMSGPMRTFPFFAIYIHARFGCSLRFCWENDDDDVLVLWKGA